MITEFLSGEFGIRELADQYEVSRKTVYQWSGRYEAGGWDGLKDQSRAPHVHPNAVTLEIEHQLLAFKAAKPLWGAPKLRHKLLGRLGVEAGPAESTVRAILRRHGLSARQGRARRAVPREPPFAHCQGANQVWGADFKGWFRTGDGQKCTPLTLSEAHSRYLLCCQGLAEATGFVTVQPLFIQTFREKGRPQALRTDNGPPFASTSLGGWTALSVWWVRLGMGLERIAPGCPQPNGRHERMHRTLKAATASPAAGGRRAPQQAFDRFRQEYHEERPHEALGQQPPASVSAPSARAYPERLPDQRGYPDEWEKRKVRQGGQIKWKGRDIRLSEALWGQEIGLEALGEGLWGIHFETLRLGTFDEREGRIERCARLPPRPAEAGRGSEDE